MHVSSLVALVQFVWFGLVWPMDTPSIYTLIHLCMIMVRVATIAISSMYQHVGERPI